MLQQTTLQQRPTSVMAFRCSTFVVPSASRAGSRNGVRSNDGMNGSRSMHLTNGRNRSNGLNHSTQYSIIRRNVLLDEGG
ncbi:hypothetical protein [Noviherbaspirillum galbum]|uniref:Uncharacterized protein n=1 Tax=Noviherbaspirillum galbum TaxID=2709383 RepID=A0A6B3ST26_9BURK|nr:hypothetical protein [Noviherbaspirillum galbum]NEX63917.1 hypothetical protein [Noviherbaspirillum galbum]